MIYEILIRGNSAGEIVGGHVIRFNQNGGIGLAEPIPMVGTDFDFDGILPESLQNVVPLQDLEKSHHAKLAEVKAEFEADLASIRSEAKNELDQQIAAASKREFEAKQQIAQLQSQITDLQFQLQESSQQIVSQDEILKRLEALEAAQI